MRSNHRDRDSCCAPYSPQCSGRSRTPLQASRVPRLVTKVFQQPLARAVHQAASIEHQSWWSTFTREATALMAETTETTVATTNANGATRRRVYGGLYSDVSSAEQGVRRFR